VAAEVQGFKRLVRTGTTVGAADKVRVDLTLQLAPAAQQVTVEANARSQARRLAQLPLSTR
jgi:hypothetical protein